MASYSSNFWTTHVCKPKEIKHFLIGPLDLWIQHKHQELQVFSKLDPTREFAHEIRTETEEPEGAVWQRWLIGHSGEFRLSASLPSRPVIVRTASPLSFIPAQKGLFFVNIPMTVQVCIKQNKENRVLTEIPTVQLSSSWFGEMTHGILSFGLRTTATREFEEVKIQPHRIICPLEIVNESKELLDFKRVLLRVANINVFLGEKAIWGNISKVRFLGQDKLSNVDYKNKPTQFDQLGDQIGDAPGEAANGLFGKSFHSITAWPLQQIGM